MKKIILILSILLLSGCTVNYDLEIEDNLIKENISGDILNEEYMLDENDSGVNGLHFIIEEDQEALINDNNSFYDKKIIDKGSYVKYNFKYNFTGNYMYSSAINSCFENVFVEETDEYYNIKLGGDFYCKISNPINVNVTTNYAVVENNADKVKKDKYTWILDSDNEEIEMKIAKVAKKGNVRKPFNYFKMISFIVVILLSCIAFLVYRVYEKNN